MHHGFSSSNVAVKADKSYHEVSLKCFDMTQVLTKIPEQYFLFKENYMGYDAEQIKQINGL